MVTIATRLTRNTSREPDANATPVRPLNIIASKILFRKSGRMHPAGKSERPALPPEKPPPETMALLLSAEPKPDLLLDLDECEERRSDGDNQNAVR